MSNSKLNCRASVPAPNAFGVHRTERAGAERHGRAGCRPSERERTSQTAYNSRATALILLPFKFSELLFGVSDVGFLSDAELKKLLLAT
jgi:hypothetical protein